MKTVLMNPGPVVLSERVRKSMLQPDLCHRESEFVELQNKIRADLLKVYALDEKEWASIVFTGSGTSALEGMLTSLVPAHGKILIVENGVYGERMRRIAEIHGIDHVVLHHEWGDAIDMEKLKGELNYHQEISHIGVVHHETTSGRLNDIEAIATLCKQRGNVSILLDAVSSFGAENIPFNDWHIAACAATANKCLHGVPGTSFVIANRDAVKQMTATPARTLYLDLITYLKNQEANGTPFTQSIQTFYGLAEALDELQEEGGWQARQQLYWQRMDGVRDALMGMGVKPYLEKDECSCVLNAFYLPDGISYEQLHDELKQAGFVIYAAQGGFAKAMFRISCMGDMSADDLKRFKTAFETIIH